MNFIRHYKLVRKHRQEVRKLCFKCGLYWQGIVHDFSKYSIIEFMEGVKYFDGTKSSTAVCREKTGKSMAWEHHKRKNKHHPEYWFKTNEHKVMPYKYAVESICDRIAACKIYKGNKYNNATPLEYWNNQKKSGYLLDNKLSNFYDVVLKDLKLYGESKILNKRYLKIQYNVCCVAK